MVTVFNTLNATGAVMKLKEDEIEANVRYGTKNQNNKVTVNLL